MHKRLPFLDHFLLFQTFEDFAKSDYEDKSMNHFFLYGLSNPHQLFEIPCVEMILS